MLLDFDVQWLPVLPSVAAGSVTMAGDSQHFMVSCGVHCQMDSKGHPCDAATCLGAQRVSVVSLPALCCVPWALALADVPGPGVHSSAIKDRDRHLLGYHGLSG